MNHINTSIFVLLIQAVLINTSLSAQQQLGSTDTPHQKGKISSSSETLNHIETKNQENIHVASTRELGPFGANLFRGKFAQTPFTGFNPDYQMNIGDQIAVRMWGAVEFDQLLTVDAQGNIFLPRVGPVNVIGIRNDELQSVIQKQIRKVFKRNVNSYTSLATNQQVKVFVTGFVTNPGLYPGLNTDSILSYLDKAGGIDPKRGSYRQVKILRGDRVVHKQDLYLFILKGQSPMHQFQDGDVVLVEQRMPMVHIVGHVQNPAQYELYENVKNLSYYLEFARPLDSATHIRIFQSRDGDRKFAYYPLKEIESLTLKKGDIIELISEKTLKNIAVRIEGENLGKKELILNPGTKLEDIISHIEYTKIADPKHIQLFRRSVKEAQAKRLHQSLAMLERSILSAAPSSREEAELRSREADMITKMIERAKALEPQGQVVLSQGDDRFQLTLEPGDIVHIPRISDVVMVHGEVLFPNAVAFQQGLDLEDYIEKAGGFSERANDDDIIILHKDGSFSVASIGWFGSSETINPGDEIFVIPEVDTKTLQLSKDIAQILYQIAVTTKVVLSL